MIVSIHQPLYLPWTGYVHKMDVSDLHIVLDHVEFDDGSFVKRNKVRTPNGWTWLTVPVHAHNDTPIHDVEVANEHRWQPKHWKTLLNFYESTPHFDEHKAFFEDVYETEWTHLVALNLHIIDHLRESLGVDTPMKRSSEMDVNGTKDELIFELCQSVDADTYLSGPNGRDYLDEARFQDAGIEVVYHDYEHPTYEQAFDGFEPYMSTIDLLFNHGPDSLEIIHTSNRDANQILREVEA